MSIRLFDDDWTDALADELIQALRCAPLSLREAERQLWAAEDSPLAEEEMRVMIRAATRRADLETPSWRSVAGSSAAASSIPGKSGFAGAPQPARRLEVERLEERKLLSSLLFLPC